MIKEMEQTLENFNSEDAKNFSVSCVETYYDLMTPIWNNCIGMSLTALKMWRSYFELMGFKNI